MSKVVEFVSLTENLCLLAVINMIILLALVFVTEV